MITYKEHHSGAFIRNDGFWVGADSTEYLNWLAEGNTHEPADPPPAPDYSALRREAYITESDPLFFKEQRQEVPVGTWLAKVNEIKARWPQV